MGRQKGSVNQSVGVMVCQMCRKQFVAEPTIWAYHRSMRMPGGRRKQDYYFCSWGCLCEAQRRADQCYGVREDPYDREKRMRQARDRRRYLKNKEKAQEG